MNNSKEAALDYCKRGWKPVPVHPRDKAPIGEAWQKLRLTEADIPKYFHSGRNVGVLLGEPSGGLVDIDLDALEAVALASYFLPQTGSIFGRKGKPRSHWLFVVDSPPKTEKFQFTFAGDEKPTTLVELRSTGVQTVFPPSKHPTRDAIRWERDDGPAIVNAGELRTQVARLAAAALLVRCWPGVNGSRQDIALALAGGLLRAGWEEEAVADFIGTVAEVAS